MPFSILHHHASQSQTYTPKYTTDSNYTSFLTHGRTNHLYNNLFDYNSYPDFINSLLLTVRKGTTTNIIMRGNFASTGLPT